MSNFDDLPDELRRHIFSYLRDKARDRILKAIADKM